VMKKLLLFALALTALLASIGSGGATASTSGEASHYTVVFNQPNGLPANVETMVAEAGGTITLRIEEIGGIGVESSNPDFISDITQNVHVKAADASLTATAGPVDDEVVPMDAENNGGTYSPPGPNPQPGRDNLYHQQWDKHKLNASDTGSYAIQQGRKEVVVAVIDTGADMTHPDIAPNLDVALSRSFVPTEPTPQDGNGHGSWCISAVGAPINVIGISGIAPNVRTVALKTLSAAGSGFFIWTDAALVYSGLIKADVASMSLGGYFPKNEAHADYQLLQRAVQFARSQGVLPVAAAANNTFNLSDGDFFRSFIEAPGEIAGVVTVSATGYHDRLSYYSNYGTPIDVTAPGGDRRYQDPPPPYLHKGRLPGAWSSTASSVPVQNEEDCIGTQCALYAWIQGTSMATPNVAGVAALIIAQYGGPRHDDIWYMSPTEVESILQITANNQPCPEGRELFFPFDPTPPGTFGPTTLACQGDVGENTFYGKGMVDALNAVTLHNT